jgi:hypothetical protein
VLGPSWVRAGEVRLYANGQLIREVRIPTDSNREHPPGVLWSEEWALPPLRHDVHLVAIAIGPGIDEPYWCTAKPYQPMTTDGTTHVLGCSGAVWLDVDGDGQPTSARTYAERLSQQHAGELPKLLAALSDYDAAVAAHAAYLQHQAGMSLTSEATQAAWRQASPATRAGFQTYLEAWRNGEVARQAAANSQP